MSSKFTIVLSTPAGNLSYSGCTDVKEDKKEGLLSFRRENKAIVTTAKVYTIIEE